MLNPRCKAEKPWIHSNATLGITSGNKKVSLIVVVLTLMAWPWAMSWLLRSLSVFFLFSLPPSFSCGVVLIKVGCRAFLAVESETEVLCEPSAGSTWTVNKPSSLKTSGLRDGSYTEKWGEPGHWHSQPAWPTRPRHQGTGTNSEHFLCTELLASDAEHDTHTPCCMGCTLFTICWIGISRSTVMVALF